ncbi:nuclear transport factor 2 family protein [Nocardioides humi]|uniref:SnoaL-like domain-containing protein n=1 Tax=Nocardioides humi TaxID=449461 RepID=A0ABN2BK17_9ACTN|nr:nuclear transport factor 2 family protein [Nocardioides humi]
MDYLAATSVAELTSADDLAATVAELCDKEAIRNLVALYSIARDDDDIDRLTPFFAEDGIFEIGGSPVQGHADLRAFYLANMHKYRTSNHVTHTHVIELAGDSATGVVTGHAELAYAGTLMVAGYRYYDDYVRQDRRWMFAHRRLRFMYAVPADQLATSFVDHLRMRWPDEEPASADIPESLDTFPIAVDS